MSVNTNQQTLDAIRKGQSIEESVSWANDQPASPTELTVEAIRKQNGSTIQEVPKQYIPEELDRRRRLSTLDHEMIRNSTESINKLAKMYNVSRRAIQFIKFPDRLQKCREQAKARAQSGTRPPSAKDKESVSWSAKKHVEYRKSLKAEGLSVSADNS